ncbi:LysR substrate-binding domain-containing protein [Agaribacterium haliotis]|uniref:LysR substrate-binding domain-containing protein n=1 Tax=Agaribacterium haliotis TaxID=2013869 RepID=UPI000BB55F68|nr:LysR substrate-binding domain-containing protein [Agaribacterium haliotis]
MRYSLRQIEVFLAIAHHENVSRAAEQLSLSQSAASGALKELENQFDVQLFDRIGKRLKLNEQGRHLRTKAESLLALATELQEDLSTDRALGNLKVGATLTIGNYLCVDLIEAYLNKAPDAHINLDIANTERIKRELLNFDIDVGMLEGEIQHPDLDIHTWREDKLICFCAPEHPLAATGKIERGELLSQAWVLREIGSGTRQSFDRAVGELGPQLNVRLELEQTEAIKRAVSKGLGLSCLSEICLEQDFKRGNLVALPCSELDLSRKLYLAVHKHKYRNASLEQWLKLCEAS